MLKMKRLRGFSIYLSKDLMSLTDVYIPTEEQALCHKSIILCTNVNRLVSILSIEYIKIHFAM